MKQFSHLTLLNLLFISLSLSLFVPLVTPLSSKLYAAFERDPDRDLLAELNKSAPHHGFTQFPVHDGGGHIEHLSLLDQGEPNHDKSLVEKGWDLYYSLNPIAQKAAPHTRGIGIVGHYLWQLAAGGKRNLQKIGPNQDEVAALKLGINIEWPGSTLHEQDRACYLQEALQSVSQIQQEFETRHTQPLSNYVAGRIADLKYFLAFTVDKSQPYYLRKRILSSLQKIHAQSKLLEFDIPKLNQTGAALIPLYTKKLGQEEAAAGQQSGAQAADHEDDLDISSPSDGEDGDQADPLAPINSATEENKE